MVILNGMLLSIEWNLTNKMALQWDLTKKKHHLPKEFTMRIQPLDYWCLFGVCPAQQSWMKQNWCSKNLNVIMQRRDWQVIYDRCLSICNYDKLYSYTADISTINVVPVYIDHFLNGGDTLWICWKSRETNHKGRTQGSSLAKTFFLWILQPREWFEWGTMRFESSAKHVFFSNSLTNLALRKGFMTGFLQISWSLSFSVHFHQWGTPIAGWFRMENPIENGWELGVPPF